MDSAAVIVNPAAGPPGARVSPAAASALVARQGFRVEVLVTARRGQAIELAAAAGARHPVVIAVGGDGTVREVATGLLGGAAALGVLPCGSGNDFARGLGLADADAGAAAAGRRAPRRIDVGFLGGRPFFNSAGFFLSGEVARRAAGLPRALGRLRYLVAAAAALARAPRPSARWRLEGERAPRTGRWTLVEVGNGPLCGGGFRLTPDADPADGALDFCLVSAIGRGAALRLLPASLRGEHLRDPRAVCARARAAMLRLAAPVWAHLDGEPLRLPPGDYPLRVVRGRLAVLAAGGAPAVRAAEARA